MSTIETLLRDEIQKEFEILEDMKVGTEEYKTAVDSMIKLCDRAIELEKFNAEQEFKREQQAVEDELKTEQIREDKKDRFVKNSLTAASIIIPSAITVWGTIKSIKFEETGTITTIMGRGFIQKLLPKK